MPYIDELAIIGEWLENPQIWLHNVAKDTVFLLRCGTKVHVCLAVEEPGNYKQWRYLRLSDSRLYYLARSRKSAMCKALILYTPVKIN